MIILGVDEVGRGCLAGPLVVGAVILNKKIPRLKDSKLLTKLQRERLSIQIKLLATDFSFGWVSAAEIDELGLTKATTLAIGRALTGINAYYDSVIIDGNYNYLKDNPKASCLIKADNLIPAVSAASIIAKVARDEYMSAQAIKFPNYGFESHVGYGTRQHLEQLKLLGISEIHRRSFRPLKSGLA